LKVTGQHMNQDGHQYERACSGRTERYDHETLQSNNRCLACGVYWVTDIRCSVGESDASSNSRRGPQLAPTTHCSGLADRGPPRINVCRPELFRDPKFERLYCNNSVPSGEDAYAATSLSGDYLGRRAARRFAGTLLRCLVTDFGVSAASNNCRNPCSNSSTAFPKAPSCPARTIATDGCRSNDGGRNTFTVSTE
jgi:hypothetical protein